MTDTTNLTWIKGNPPEASQGAAPRGSKYETLYAALDANPGVWAELQDVPASLAILLRKRGYEASVRGVRGGSSVTRVAALYARKPLEATA